MKPKIKYVFIPVFLATFCLGQSVSEIVAWIQQGQFDQAQAALNQLEKTSRTTDSVLFLKGLIAREADQAMGFYQQLVKTYPKSEYTQKALFRIAQLKYAQGLYQSSLMIFLNIRDEDPKSTLLQESHYWAGLCCLSMNQQDSAVIHFGRVITEFPKREASRLAGLELKAMKIHVPLLSEEDLSDTGSELNNTNLSGDNTHSVQDTPIKSSNSNSSPTTHYSIQIGAFSQQSNALIRKNFFESKGYPVNLRSKSVSGKTLYLVWVGDFVNEMEARALAETLKNKYETRTTLVSEIR